MALSTPSSVPENQGDIQFSSEAQARIDAVANGVIVALDKNLDAQNAIKDIFGKMVAENLRDPVSVGKIQDGLYAARDMRLEKADPADRLSILESFSKFMGKFTQGIAQMYRDIELSNEANALKSGSDAKISQVKATYAQIITDTHPTLTA